MLGANAFEPGLLFGSEVGFTRLTDLVSGQRITLHIQGLDMP